MIVLETKEKLLEDIALPDGYFFFTVNDQKIFKVNRLIPETHTLLVCYLMRNYNPQSNHYADRVIIKFNDETTVDELAELISEAVDQFDLKYRIVNLDGGDLGLENRA